MPMLSIVIPVYQVRTYLKRCLESVLSQTFKNYEVILVDDGSTDGSADLCDEYAQKYPVMKVIHKENGGLSSARNVGIDAASGEYIMFVDSDDVIHRQLAEIEMNAIKVQNADAAVCCFRRFSSDEEIAGLSDLETDQCTLITGMEAESMLLENDTQTHFTSSCGKIYRKELFEGLRFPEGRLFEDEFLIFKLYYRCKKIAVIQQEMYFYFINNAGITRTLTLNKRFDEYDAQSARIEFFRDNNLPDLYHQALLRFLKTAQWDLIKCQKKSESCDEKKAAILQDQYTFAARSAIKARLINFKTNYDYYVLAFPKQIFVLRLRRFMRKLFR